MRTAFGDSGGCAHVLVSGNTEGNSVLSQPNGGELRVSAPIEAQR